MNSGTTGRTSSGTELENEVDRQRRIVRRIVGVEDLTKLDLVSGESARDANPFNPARFLRGIGRRWFVCLLLGLMVGGVCAAVVWSAVFKGYVAKSYVRVRSQDAAILPGNTRDRRSLMDSEVFRNTQLQILELPHVLRRALDDPSVKDLPEIHEQVDAEAWLAGRIEFDFPRQSEVMELSVLHSDAATAQKLVNALTNAYLQEASRLEEPDRRRQRDELERQYARLEVQLQSRWETLQNLAKKLGSGSAESLTLREQNELENYRDYARRLRQVRFDRRDAQTELAYLRQSQSSAADSDATIEISEAEVEFAIDRSPAVVVLLQEINQLAQRLAEAEALDPTGQDPAIRRLRQQNDSNQKSLGQLRLSLRPQIVAQLKNTAKASRQQRLEELEIKAQNLEQDEKFLVGMLEEIEKQRLMVGGGSSVQLELLRRDIDRLDSMADSLWTAKEAVRIEDQASKRVELIALADLPKKPDYSRRVKLSAVAGCGGFGLIVLLIGVWEYRAGRIMRHDDVKPDVDIEVIGTVPKSSAGAVWADNQRGDSLQDIDWAFRDGLDVLAARIMFSDSSKGCRRLMITSALPDEGKSTLSMHLAASLARAGRRTLLIDFDLERPSLARLLHLASKPGVGDLILGKSDCGAAIISTSQPSLDFLPSGDPSIDPHEILTSQALGDFFAQFDGLYDFLLLDTPPVLAAVDALLIGQHAETTVFSVLSNVSKNDQVRMACERLRAVNIEVFGAVVNGVNPRHDTYYRYSAAYRATQQQRKQLDAAADSTGAQNGDDRASSTSEEPS